MVQCAQDCKKECSLIQTIGLNFLYFTLRNQKKKPSNSVPIKENTGKSKRYSSLLIFALHGRRLPSPPLEEIHQLTASLMSDCR